MGYDSKQGFYYNFFVNDKEQDFNPSFLTNLELYHSIFDLFPTVSFSLLNKENLYYQIGLANPNNKIKIQMGTSEDDDNIETFKNLIIEKMQISNTKADLSGELIFKITNKNNQELSVDSPAKGWPMMSSSEVITSIISPYFRDFSIEDTKNRGNWLKPNNQSELSFLKILKNRSLAAFSSPSKMFMWIDLEGEFHFESLNSLLVQTPVVILDFDESITESLNPTDFDYVDNGIDYTNEGINQSFKEYKFNKIAGLDLLLPLIPPIVSKLDGVIATEARSTEDITRTQTILQGYTHSKLPKDYNKAIYTNNVYNFPYRFSFIMSNIPEIQPGKKIRLVFKHHDENEVVDQSLSGDYLIVAVKKREETLNYINEVYVVSNSQRQPLPTL